MNATRNNVRNAVTHNVTNAVCTRVQNQNQNQRFWLSLVLGHLGQVPNPKLRKQGRLGFGILTSTILLAALAGCGGTDDGLSNQERDDQRYRACLAAGGSYWTDDVDYGCNLPGSASGR